MSSVGVGAADISGVGGVGSSSGLGMSNENTRSFTPGDTMGVSDCGGVGRAVLVLVERVINAGLVNPNPNPLVAVGVAWVGVGVIGDTPSIKDGGTPNNVAPVVSTFNDVELSLCDSTQAR